MYKNKFFVGRNNQDISINSSSVSNKHLLIELLGNNQAIVTDQNTMNGTYLVKKIGKIKIHEKKINIDDVILLADVKTTVRKLLASIGVDGSSNLKSQTDELKSQLNQPYSVYVRNQSGQFKEKK